MPHRLDGSGLEFEGERTTEEPDHDQCEQPLSLRQPSIPAKFPSIATSSTRIMDAAGLDVLIVTSKHNIQYLLGGYRFFFFDAHGCDRPEPLFAGVHLSEGASGGRRLYRQFDGILRARAWPLLGAQCHHQDLGHARCHASWRSTISASSTRRRARSASRPRSFRPMPMAAAVRTCQHRDRRLPHPA